MHLEPLPPFLHLCGDCPCWGTVANSWQCGDLLEWAIVGCRGRNKGVKLVNLNTNHKNQHDQVIVAWAFNKVR